MEYKFLKQRDRGVPVTAYECFEGEFPTDEGERDKDFFFTPKKMNKSRTRGLVCAMLGDTPENRRSDYSNLMELYAKEAYEHKIGELMCNVKLIELRTLWRFAEQDRIKKKYKLVDTDPANVKIERAIRIESITWQYDWIQMNKKDCYLFAEYTFEMLVMAKLDAEKEAFRKDFIRRACEIPEANRRLIDTMYELAWRTIVTYSDLRDIPENLARLPWYDVLR